jgi:MFS family permease
MDRVRILAPLRHDRDFRFLTLGALPSLLGDGIFLVALPLQVYALSNVPTAMAVVGVIWASAQLSMLLIGGWASDRFERRLIMFAADVARGTALIALGALSLSGNLELWHLWVVGALVGACNAFFNPALQSIVPDLVADERLPQANAFLGMARPAMSRLLGPAIGGVIVGGAGAGAAFVVDGLTFGLSALFLLRIARRPAAGGGGSGGALREVAEGFRYVRSQRWLWLWLLAAAVGLLAFTGPVDMLLPFILRNDMGLTESQAAYSLGVILAVGGVGSVTVSAFVGQLDLPRRFVTAMYLVEAGAVALLAVYGLMTSVWHALAAAFLLNAAFAFTDIAWITLLQRAVPRRLLGRVSSVDWLTSLGLMPLSFAVAGPLAAAFGARQVLVVGAVAGSALLLALMLVPGAREPERWDRVPDDADCLAPDPMAAEAAPRGLDGS